MYQRIIVPLDGSETAEQVLPKAEELSHLIGAPLHLVRVVEIGNPGMYGTYLPIEGMSYVEMLSSAEAAVREYLEEQHKSLSKRGFKVTFEVRRGDPSNELVEVCQPDDLIVMSTHGRSGVARWVLGSVAERVVRHAPVPVFLVRADNKAERSTEAVPGEQTPPQSGNS